MTDKPNLLDYDRNALELYFTRTGDKAFRVRQLMKWIYHHGIIDFQAMTDLAESVRTKLQADTCIRLPQIVNEQQSEDGTRKWLVRLNEKKFGGNRVHTGESSWHTLYFFADRLPTRL